MISNTRIKAVFCFWLLFIWSFIQLVLVSERVFGILTFFLLALLPWRFVWMDCHLKYNIINLTINSYWVPCHCVGA